MYGIYCVFVDTMEPNLFGRMPRPVVCLLTAHLQVRYQVGVAAKANHGFKWNSSKLWETKGSSEIFL